ncbi:multicopper oxidase domain-containing protein [Roseovarius gahaiensis]|uniref:Multicopper oxidase domain-containing protein n=1 Tax=Roseovarius gahaiensis TaxID=2716691 RepID=A0A967EJ59_9RHOB|nr:multicopper oxidase domain-containing protein [Roseovarius gahaiensis]
MGVLLFHAAQETREIGFWVDNTGDRLFHCHMISHAKSGMITRVQVT